MKKRLCLFGGYDCNNEIDDYVIYLIKALSKYADVYYYGDFSCPQSELDKLKPYCKGTFAKRHKKYDFGSWQELIKIIGKDKIREYDELIITNDSCFGPIFPLDEVFKKMDAKNCDFWGLTASRGYHIHIQSYFVVFRKSVLESDVLFNFLDKVKPEKSLREVCDKYEDRMTYVLSKAGYTFDTFIPYTDKVNHPYFNTTNAITNVNFPLLKVKTFYGKVGYDLIKDWKTLLRENTNYDINLITKNLSKRGLTEEEIYNYMYAYKKTRKLVKIRSIVYKVLKLVLYPVRKLLHRFVDNKIEYIVNIYNYQFAELNDEIHSLKSQLLNVSNKMNMNIANKQKMKNVVIEESKNELLPKGYQENEDTFIFKNIKSLYKVLGEDDRDVLFIGNFENLKCYDFKFNDNNIIIINDDDIEEAGCFENCCYNVENLEDFTIKNGKEVIKFDFIFVQALLKLSNKRLKNMLLSLKKMMMYETTLFINIKNEDYNDFKKVADEVGLVSDMDAYGMFIDKVTNGGSYQSIFLKLKK